MWAQPPAPGARGVCKGVPGACPSPPPRKIEVSVLNPSLWDSLFPSSGALF